ncbi:MAG: DNA polymerase III subunit delta' [Gammaproteobacteria bacterium]
MAVNSTPGWQELPLPWQQPAWQRVNHWLAGKRLPHALLLHDSADGHSELFAMALAARVLCAAPEDGRACGRCPSCRQLTAGAHPDYRAVSIEADKTGIGVAQIRELSAALVLTSQYGRGKIAVLHPADAMNVNAQNSLLKTLEEPSPGTLLLLVTAYPARLLPTIRSRCQRLVLQAQDPDVALAWLNARDTRADWAVLLAIAGGAPLAALECASLPLFQRRLDFFHALLELRAGRRNPLAWGAELGREPLPQVLRLLQVWVLDLIVLLSTGNDERAPLINTDACALLQSGAQSLNLRQLHVYLDHIGQSLRLVDVPVNRQLQLELLLMEWAEGLQTQTSAPLAALTG